MATIVAALGIGLLVLALIAFLVLQAIHHALSRIDDGVLAAIVIGAVAIAILVVGRQRAN